MTQDQDELTAAAVPDAEIEGQPSDAALALNSRMGAETVATVVANVRRHVEKLEARAASWNEPVIIGPWIGEVGYELLYWIPFLRWILASHPTVLANMVVPRGSQSGIEAARARVTDCSRSCFPRS